MTEQSHAVGGQAEPSDAQCAYCDGSGYWIVEHDGLERGECPFCEGSGRAAAVSGEPAQPDGEAQ